MRLINIHELLKKYVGQGFSLESLSLVTQLSVETLTKMVDDPTYIPNDHDNLIYLHIFIMQLELR